MKNKMPYYNARALFTGLAISYIFALNSSSFWLSSLLGTLFGVILLYFVPSVTNNKYIKALSGFVIVLISSTILVNMAHTLYLENTPIVILAVTPLLAVISMTTFKDKAITRVVSIFFTYSMILFVLKCLSLFPKVELDNLRPFWNSSFLNILKGAFVFTITSTTPILTFNDIKNKKSIILNYLISMLTVVTIMFLAMGVLGSKEVIIYRYPEYVMLKKINLLNFVSNVDHFFSFAIILDLMFTIYAGFKCIEKVNKSTKYVAFVLILIMVVFFCNLNYPLLLMYHYFPYVLTLLLVLLVLPKE